MDKDTAYSVNDISSILLVLEVSSNIVILPHTSPDGDALGASIGLCRILRNIYSDKNISIVSPDKIENYLSWMTELGDVVVWEDKNSNDYYVNEADLFIHLDHNSIDRLKNPSLISAVRSNQARSIMIDHHLYPSKDFSITISRPDISSTCELIYKLIVAMNWNKYLDNKAATSILTGIITDTGRFLYNCPSPSVFYATSYLLEKGADIEYINDRLNYHSPMNRIKLHGYAVNKKMEIHENISAAIISLSIDEMKKYSATKGDTEGLANLPLEIEGVNCSVLMREDIDYIKLSFRSTGNFPVNKIAEQFSGGGHMNAAGGEFYGSMEEAKKKYIEIVKGMLE